jgi:transcriptional regulator with XRE-family HTH domain
MDARLISSDGWHIMKETLRKSLGIVIKRRREHLALSQDQLALRADLHRTYISDVERGARNLSFDSIYCVAKGLGVLPSLLFAEAELDAYKSAGELIGVAANSTVLPEEMPVSPSVPAT